MGKRIVNKTCSKDQVIEGAMEVVHVLDALIVNQCARIGHPLFTDLLLIFKVIEHLQRELLVLLVHGVDRRPHCHSTTHML